VLPLRTVATRRGGAVAEAALAAVARIQARLEGAAPGQLAIADAEAGELSVAEEGETAGLLSLSAEGRSAGPSRTKA
jgi:hypothetical protein